MESLVLSKHTPCVFGWIGNGLALEKLFECEARQALALLAARLAKFENDSLRAPRVLSGK